MNLFRFLASLYAPISCGVCQDDFEDAPICTKCIGELRITDPYCYRCNSKMAGLDVRAGNICRACQKLTPLDSLLYCYDYEVKVHQDILHSLKYNGYQAAAGTIAVLIRQKIDLTLPGLDTAGARVSYAPTAPKRVRLRGYDQAELIAKKIAPLAKIQFTPMLLRTSDFDMIGATREVRFKEAEHLFSVDSRARKDIQNATIILIDDVVTTGASLESAAKLLKKSGAKYVYAYTYLRKGAASKI